MLKGWFEHDGHNMDFHGYKNDGMGGGGGGEGFSLDFDLAHSVKAHTPYKHFLCFCVICGHLYSRESFSEESYTLQRQIKQKLI